MLPDQIDRSPSDVLAHDQEELSDVLWPGILHGSIHSDQHFLDEVVFFFPTRNARAACDLLADHLTDSADGALEQFITGEGSAIAIGDAAEASLDTGGCVSDIAHAENCTSRAPSDGFSWRRRDVLIITLLTEI